MITQLIHNPMQVAAYLWALLLVLLLSVALAFTLVVVLVFLVYGLRSTFASKKTDDKKP